MPDPTPLPQGKDWRLHGLKDTRENVIESVQAAAFIPDACKAMLVEDLNTTHAKSRLVSLNAHRMIVQTSHGLKSLLTVDISQI